MWVKSGLIIFYVDSNFTQVLKGMIIKFHANQSKTIDLYKHTNQEWLIDREMFRQL